MAGIDLDRVRRLAAGETVVARYPGDTIRSHQLQRDGELGDIVIQDYGEKFRIGAFLPGTTECPPGDTPKTWPDVDAWCMGRGSADTIFDHFVRQAKEDGWKDYTP